ncbi:HN1_G0000010.mRNA.1.CDS.1 [Saccharomyces cerevisiae]|nr:HN1_G0000010.mRNA.1.CDS.1 [Saccharomyces cerevisiae]
MVNLANVLTNATAATLSEWSNTVPLETYFHFDDASGFGDYYLNLSVIWMNETLYETRIVPAIINVREWLDDMEANVEVRWCSDHAWHLGNHHFSRLF